MRTVLLATALVMIAGTAPAADAAASVEARQKGMKAVGVSTKAMNDGLNGDASAAELKAIADRLDALAEQSAGWFPAGSGPGSGVKTKARAEVWSKAGEFSVRRADFAAKADKLRAAAASGNRDATQAAFGAFRGTCKGCHDDFKES